MGGSIALLLVLGSGTASASPEEVATDVANDVMSPFCPGLTLHDCPSDAAASLRERIEGWARDGLDHEQIVARLRAEYGRVIEAAPPTEGAGLVAWLLPSLVALAGVGLAWSLARRWSARAAHREAPAAPSGDERRRLDAELADLRRST
ncbi:MAG: cytochrome c-type biogenesis protein CcmH [Actinomycetota bacterium]